MSSDLDRGQVNQLIAEKRFEEAMAILRQSTDPAAKKWLDSLEKRINPEPIIRGPDKISLGGEEQLQKAGRGEFDCIVYSDASELKGAPCFVHYPTSGAKFFVREDGIHFTDITFWRNKTAEAVGGGMSRSLSVGGFFAFAATTEIKSLIIPWGEMKMCFVAKPKDETEAKALHLVFNNPSKKRVERIKLAFAVAGADKKVYVGYDKIAETQLMDVFLDGCRKRGIPIEENETR